MDIASTVKAIVILNLDGKRALAKYYDKKINSNSFDKQLFKKTKTKDEILVIDGFLVAHKCVAASDLHVYVVGSRNENPLILDQLLCCLTETIFTLLNKNSEPQSVAENLDQIILALDEVCSEGIVLEMEPELLLKSVCLKDGVAEQSMAQVLQSATEHLKFPWIRS